MSYILDALKKLEKKRIKNAVPGLLSAQEGVGAKPAGRQLWKYLIFLALLLNAAVLLWRFIPEDELQKPSAPIAPSTKSRESVSPPEAVKPLVNEDMHVTASVADRKKTSIQSGAGDAAVSNVVAVNDVSGRIYDIKELPASIRQGLPGISVSGLFYSDTPGSRVVVVNGKLAHEGAEVAQGLILEKIAPDGVIFHYGDYLFRITVFRGH